MGHLQAISVILFILVAIVGSVELYGKFPKLDSSDYTFLLILSGLIIGMLGSIVKKSDEKKLMK